MTEQSTSPAKRNCDGQPSLAPATGSAHDRNTQIIREECERRIEVCRVNILEAGFALRHMNPRRAAEMLDQCEKYANLASLDAAELSRRLNAPNDGLEPSAR